MHGYGNYYFLNGDVYSGEFQQGKRQGKGSLKFANSAEIYEGEFLNNLFHGHGVYYYKSGNVYDGSWNEDKKHGQGTYKFANGDYYIGEFSNNLKNGLGKYYHAKNNFFQEGIWKDDKFVNF